MNFAALNPLNWFKRTDAAAPAATGDLRAPGEIAHNGWSPLLSGYGPGVNLLESEREYQIELAVPGLTRSDLNIELQGDQLLISGAQSRRQSVEVNGQQWSLARAGFFQRRFTLPADAKADSLDAELKNGLLTLTVERNPSQKPARRAITIH